MNALPPLSPRRCLLAMTFVLLAHLHLLKAQHSPCATPPPTPAEMAEAEAKMSQPSASASGLTWQIPVRVTVFRKNDGSGWNFDYDDTFIDEFLSNMNAKVASGPNTFNFFRCGPINFIDVDQLYDGSQPPEAYSYNRNYLNLYIYNKPGHYASASFPWYPEPKAVWMPSGISSTSDATGFHELGHTLGLFHTFSPEVNYIVPVTQNQQDHPYIQGGRELVIRDSIEGVGKEFPEPNHEFAGDRVSDTPPGCDSDPARAKFYPSPATLAGCLDSDPNTPCINGCSWDYVNCTYTGDYRDYNFDPLVDSANVLARNIMSYTGSCRTNFTPGQVARADLIANVFLNDYYQEQLCGNLLDRVEIEGSNLGLDRVNIRIAPVAAPADYTQTIVSAAGDFSGKLPVSNFSVQVSADLKRFRSSDVTQLDNNWLSGLTTFDVLCIQRHVLALDTLDGYKQLAADANKSNSVTAADVLLFRRIILGIDTALAAYSQPWRFIPEVVTQQTFGGGLQADFDGIGFDMPFSTIPPAMGPPALPPTIYCEPTWAFLMRVGAVRNGFDAVKLGNICGKVVTGEEEQEKDCPGEMVMLVPELALANGDTFQVSVKSFGAQSVAAFQMGIGASAEDFEYLSHGSAVFSEMSEEDAFLGGLNLGHDDIKVSWLSDELSPTSIANGSTLLTITLKARRDINDLRDAIALDNRVLETYFLTQGGGCQSGTSLEMEAHIIGPAEDRGSDSDGAPLSSRAKIFCLPNPAADRLTVLFDTEHPFAGYLFVHDLQGRLLKTIAQDFSPGRNVFTLNDFAQLPPGVLNISIFDGKETHSVRVAKQ